MNISNKVKLIWLYFKGDISAHNKKVLEAALASSDAGKYQLDMGAFLITNKRRFPDEPLRSVIRGHSGLSGGSNELGIACTMNAAKTFEPICKQCMYICKFIHEFNMVQREKYVGTDAQVGRNSHLRPRERRDDSSKSSSDKG